MRREKLEELKMLIDELKTIDKIKKDCHGTFISSEVYTCSLNNGKTITREKLLKGGLDGSAALILPVLEDRSILLTVEPRVFSKRTVGIGVPAGYIEAGEEAKLAAARELREETGYLSDNIISLGGFYQDMGCSGAYNKIFIGFNARQVSNQNLDKDEYIRYFNCYFKEALELIDLGYIEGCNAIITLERAKTYMKGRR